MLLWFVGAGVVVVWLVFRSPALDYRLVALGSVLPLVDAAFGGPRFLHTLAAPVLTLTVVMVLTRKRRLLRRRWLGLPIGLFLHLVLDGTWTRKQVLWWPLFGTSFGHRQVPELTHGAAGWVLEVAGLACIAWIFERFHLRDPRHRAAFLRSGQLPRELAHGPEAGC